QRVALVGETGGGKSTTLKLLYRFYDVTAGSISIDGQDIRDVTLTSLRDVLAAIPQDPSNTDTVPSRGPGERGVRLSGGELQRLAIARIILRRSKIVVLDEATSAVDSETETLIQQAIGALSAGCTVFMIAHWGIVGPGGPLVYHFVFPWSPGSEHS
ncbi:hypothetical protein E4U38_000353, partial [Claviceps purpurea]